MHALMAIRYRMFNLLLTLLASVAILILWLVTAAPYAHRTMLQGHPVVVKQLAWPLGDQRLIWSGLNRKSCEQFAEVYPGLSRNGPLRISVDHQPFSLSRCIKNGTVVIYKPMSQRTRAIHIYMPAAIIVGLWAFAFYFLRYRQNTKPTQK